MRGMVSCMPMSVESLNPIGVFDSGVGGISVLREIKRLLPAENLIYVADSGHAPYGSKTPEYIIARCQQVSQFLLAEGAKALVVACNTATAHAIEPLRATLSVPVIGIEPAVKPAARMTQTGVIGVLATQQTVQSARLQRLIREYAGDVKVLAQACPGLVEHVEQGDFSSDALRQLLKAYALPLLEQGADTLVLGCTHYPFLSDTLHDITHGKVTVLETSTAVAHQVMRVLQQRGMQCLAERAGSVQFYSSKADEGHWRSMEWLWQQALDIRLLPEPFLFIPPQRPAQGLQ